MSTQQEAADARTLASVIRKVVRKIMHDEHIIEIKWATVELINTGPPATVNLRMQASPLTGPTGGIIPNISYLSSYTPTLSDTVVVASVGTDLWVIGVLA